MLRGAVRIGISRETISIPYPAPPDAPPPAAPADAPPPPATELTLPVAVTVSVFSEAATVAGVFEDPGIRKIQGKIAFISFWDIRDTSAFIFLP